MANEEHLRILKQGVDVWNQWRKEHPEIWRPDFREANLSFANLGEANLSHANLSHANLSHADLSFANLSHADLSFAHLSAADLSHADLSDADLNHADLNYANLNHADLSHADLSLAKLFRARLFKARLFKADLGLTKLLYADLSQANLSQADLSYAALSGADLSGADLSGADLSGADLSEANLSEANLSYAVLCEANLSYAALTDTRIGGTIFSNVDLSEVKGLETIHHLGPSTIGIDTITASQGKIPEAFFKGAGLPDVFITYMQSLTSEAINFYSCFISYSTKDQGFAERLHADLQAKGVRCWFAPSDLIIGEPFILGIEKGIRLHEKLLLVLSEHSVGSGWVQHEVLLALAKEQGKAPWVLFPIRLDDAVLTTDVDWANIIRQRHIGEFTHWKDHDAYQKAFDRLLHDLKADASSKA